MFCDYIIIWTWTTVCRSTERPKKWCRKSSLWLIKYLYIEMFTRMPTYSTTFIDIMIIQVFSSHPYWIQSLYKCFVCIYNYNINRLFDLWFFYLFYLCTYLLPDDHHNHSYIIIIIPHLIPYTYHGAVFIFPRTCEPVTDLIVVVSDSRPTATLSRPCFNSRR